MLLLSLVFSVAHPNLQVFFQSNLASVAYQQGVFQKVAKQLTVPAAKPAVGRKTVVQAIIARNGAVMSTTVSLESGSKPWDQAALNAVKRASPFAPLPKDFAAESVEVHFHLTWEP